MNMETSTKLMIMNGVERFPIGGSLSDYEMNKMDYLTSKAAIVAYIMEREYGMSEAGIRDLFANALESELPSLPLAETRLQLSNGFIDDFSKMELLKNSNAKSFEEMMKMLKKVMEEYGYSNGMSR